MTQLTPELWHETLDDINHSTVHASHGLNYREISIFFAESYLSGVLWFHFHWSGEPGYFYPLFKLKAADLDLKSNE